MSNVNVIVKREDIVETCGSDCNTEKYNPVLQALRRILKSSWNSRVYYGSWSYLKLFSPDGINSDVPFSRDVSQFLSDWDDGVFRVLKDHGVIHCFPRKDAEPFNFELSLPNESIRIHPVQLIPTWIRVSAEDFQSADRFDPARSPLSNALRRYLPSGWTAELGFNHVSYWHHGDFSGEVAYLRKKDRKELDKWMSVKRYNSEAFNLFLDVIVNNDE